MNKHDQPCAFYGVDHEINMVSHVPCFMYTMKKHGQPHPLFYLHHEITWSTMCFVLFLYIKDHEITGLSQLTKLCLTIIT